jgi:hypothetical protein
MPIYSRQDMYFERGYSTSPNQKLSHQAESGMRSDKATIKTGGAAPLKVVPCLRLHPRLALSTVIHVPVRTDTLPLRLPISRSLLSSCSPLSLPQLNSRILTFGHAFLGLKYRTWFFSAMFVVGGIGIPVCTIMLTVRGGNRIHWTRRFCL